MRVVVAGAGIGGLAAAVAAKREGLDAVVLERAPELKPLGAALKLWPNGLRVLQQLDLADAVERAGTRIEFQEHLTATGKQLARWPVGEWGRRLDAPNVAISRTALHAVLTDAVGAALSLGSEVVGYDEDYSAVTVRLANGAAEHGEVLVGADGVRSAVRAQLLGPSEPRYSGVTSWRAIVNHAPVRPDTVVLVWGRGAMLVSYPVGDGRTYWLALAKSRPGATEEGRGDVLERFDDFFDPIPEIIEATDEATVIRTDIVDRDPIDTWGRGRVTLLGDSAHAMTPNLAQGACQALEDGLTLARALARGDGDVAALRAYEDQRRDRAAKCVKGSRQATKALAIDGRVRWRVRDLALRPVTRLIAPRKQFQLVSESEGP